MTDKGHSVRPAALLLLVGLPLLGILCAGKPFTRYLEFPPTTHYVSHAPFAWPVFIALAMFIVICVGPFIRQVIRHRHDPVEAPGMRPFPWWGWAGVGLGGVAWILAWNRFPWFAGWQEFTFTPLWVSYIVVVNALCYRRSGHCMLLDRPSHMAGLFLASAGFWWFFEYLNRFVQNWYYEGIGNLSPLQYFIFATLPFATVLPAVMGTYELLATYRRLTAGLASYRPFKIKRSRLVAGMTLVAAGAGLAGVGVWPDYLFPLLWLAPLFVISSLQTLTGQPTVFADLERGDWRRVVLLAVAALVCGFFWEMWNYRSLARWIYTVPYVYRFKVFEMPILGYAGYLPFGLECAVIAGCIGEKSGAPARNHIGRCVMAMLIAALVWLPLVHFVFKPRLEDWRAPRGIPQEAAALAGRQFAVWTDPALAAGQVARMRATNAEWDFMARTYLVLALANMSLRDPADQPRYLAAMDRMIADTLRLERAEGTFHFLMEYARNQPYLKSGGRSLFQDGEIALMLAARRMVAEHDAYRALLTARIEAMATYMTAGPILSGESYPDECWTFCNTIALAAMRMADALDGADHRDFCDRWLAQARQHLIDPRTGLLIASYSLAGAPYNGPEGSSIWMAAHCLQLIDPAFAADQYRRARKELGRTVLGFGYAREWPATWPNQADVDSGPIIPVLEISSGSSGLALVGAAAFGDDEYLASLLTSLRFGGFPTRDGKNLRFCASNTVGDAVMLYALVLGPLWEKAATHLAAGGRRHDR